MLGWNTEGREGRKEEINKSEEKSQERMGGEEGV